MPAVPVHFCTSCFSPACLCVSLQPILYCISFCSDCYHSRFETLSTQAFFPCNIFSPLFPKKYDSSFRQTYWFSQEGSFTIFQSCSGPWPQRLQRSCFRSLLLSPCTLNLLQSSAFQLQEPCPNFAPKTLHFSSASEAIRLIYISEVMHPESAPQALLLQKPCTRFLLKSFFRLTLFQRLSILSPPQKLYTPPLIQRPCTLFLL